MIRRSITEDIEKFFSSNDRNALLVSGPPLTGKTEVIREYGRMAFRCFVEISLADEEVLSTVRGFRNTKDLLTRLSAVAGGAFEKGETLIFIDNVECLPDILTAVKFLVDDGRYRYVLACSLTDTLISSVRSIPVGYMARLDMHPLSLPEFFRASGISDEDIASLKTSCDELVPVDVRLHEKCLELFSLYLKVGGMPSAVEVWLETGNIERVREEQKRILGEYGKIIRNAERRGMDRMEDIFRLIPSELGKADKRFFISSLGRDMKSGRCGKSFGWLENSGLTIPVHHAVINPYLRKKKHGLFKLFPCDVGLLYASGASDAYGELTENAVVEELVYHGIRPFCYTDKKNGELDFVITVDDAILPVIVSVGKDYHRHSALKKVMADGEYGLKKAVVLSGGNVKVKGNVVYLPVYMAAFIRNSEMGSFIYKVDLSGLT